MIEILTVVLSLAGLAISVFFTLAYYGRIERSRWIPPNLCAREGSNCVTVLRTPYARVFGLPNSLLGIIFYIGLIIWRPGHFKVRLGEPLAILYMVPGAALVAASAVSVVLGFYLIHVLRTQLRVNCALCYTAHLINLLIFVLLVVGAL